jgi:hypothetical protein
MGVFSRRKQATDVPSPEDWVADPQAAMRRAMHGTDTYVDEQGNRRKLTPQQREDMENLRPPSPE